MSDYKVVVVIPAYNEERFIRSVVLETKQFADEVIVIDDGSTDATARMARAAGATLLSHAQNQGKGAALMTGFDRAVAMDADVVVTLDADGQHLPQELGRIIEPIVAGQADMAIGSRYLRHRGSVPRHRVLGHKLVGFMTNHISGTDVTDTQSGFRAFSRLAAECMVFRSKGFAVESEMQFLAHDNGLMIREVPITIQYIDAPKRPVFFQGMEVFNGILRLAGLYRPLLIFGTAGLSFITGGALLAYGATRLGLLIPAMSVRQLLLGVFLLFTGVVSFATGLSIHAVRTYYQKLDRSRRNGKDEKDKER